VDDKYFKVAVRRRLRCLTLVPRQSQTCCHRSRDGHCRGAVLPPDNGHRAVCCSGGGGAMVRRGAVRDTLASWLREDLGLSVHTEQEVPRWSTLRERGRSWMWSMLGRLPARSGWTCQSWTAPRHAGESVRPSGASPVGEGQTQTLPGPRAGSLRAGHERTVGA